VLASGEIDGKIKLWDIVSGQETGTLAGHYNGTNLVAFSPDGTRIASSGEDGTAKVWEIASRQELTTISGYERVLGDQMVFSPDSKYLVTWAFGAVITWEVSSGRELQKLRGSKLYASNIALSPTGKLLAAAYSDGIKL
jgi:WD40 repeat protein